MQTKKIQIVPSQQESAKNVHNTAKPKQSKQINKWQFNSHERNNVMQD